MTTRSLARHNRATLEALASRDDLAEELLDSAPPWPRRRFRVEGTLAGSSRLLRHQAAAKVQARLGGRVVAVLPPWGRVPGREPAPPAGPAPVRAAPAVSLAAGAPYTFETAEGWVVEIDRSTELPRSLVLRAEVVAMFRCLAAPSGERLEAALWALWLQKKSGGRARLWQRPAAEERICAACGVTGHDRRICQIDGAHEIAMRNRVVANRTRARDRQRRVKGKGATQLCRGCGESGHNARTCPVPGAREIAAERLRAARAADSLSRYHRRRAAGAR